MPQLESDMNQNHYFREKFSDGSARCLRTLLLTLLLTPFTSQPARADEDSQAAGATSSTEQIPAAPPLWELHAQATATDQWHPAFHAEYSGAQSLNPHAASAETVDVTLFAGIRVWQNAGLYLNPEIDQGYGLSNTTGLAGFPSGEAYKIGANAPYLRIPRAFIRQVINLGGETQTVESSANQLAASQTSNNLSLTIGKYSVVDLFDTNSYAHDPRADFLNWAVIDSGAYDYAADSWAFTYGGALEWNQDWWSVRAGLFDLSTVPNGKQPDPDFGEFETVVEFEERHQWQEHPGKLKLLLYLNRGNMASYLAAISQAEETGSVPNVGTVRRFQSRPGMALNVEQELSASLGMFARASAADGSKESYDFTDIDRSLAVGISLRGDGWERHDDTIGVALVANALARDAREYFAAGGLGILIGDGRLDYGTEQICETYYRWHLGAGTSISADYQFIQNPAYNRDRGPVSIFAIRLHTEM